MTEALREMNYEEMVSNIIINILENEVPFDVKSDLIGHVLSLYYQHKREIQDALYTPTPSCVFQNKESGY